MTETCMEVCSLTQSCQVKGRWSRPTLDHWPGNRSWPFPFPWRPEAAGGSLHTRWAGCHQMAQEISSQTWNNQICLILPDIKNDTHTQLPDVISLMLFMVPSVRIVHFLKSHLATASSLSKNWASTMETSSMIRCLQLVQCCSTPGLWASWMHCSREAEPEPIPGKRTRGRNVNRGTKGSMNEQHTCRHPTYSFCILRFN